MSFKPKRKQSSGGNGGGNFKYPAPAKDGNQACRVSLIVDLGIQDRPNYEELYNKDDEKHQNALENRGATIVVPEYGDNKGKEVISIPQSPKQGVAVFVDLVGATVDYGGEIGEKHYRYMLNKSFKGDVSPITFDAVPPKAEGGLWTFHGGSVLTKLAKATGNTQIISEGDDNMDIEQLLGAACLIDLEVNVVKKGEREFTNVKHNALSGLIDGMAEPAELMTDARLVTFDDATAEDIKFIRKDVKEKIKLAHNFAGSAMESAFKEAGLLDGTSAPQDAPSSEGSAPEAAADDDFDDDVPF